MLADLAKAKSLIGSPMGAYVYPRGLIRDWKSATVDSIDALIETAKAHFSDKVHIETDMAKAVADADLVIESMAEDPKAKRSAYTLP